MVQLHKAALLWLLTWLFCTEWSSPKKKLAIFFLLVVVVIGAKSVSRVFTPLTKCRERHVMWNSLLKSQCNSGRTLMRHRDPLQPLRHHPYTVFRNSHTSSLPWLTHSSSSLSDCRKIIVPVAGNAAIFPSGHPLARGSQPKPSETMSCADGAGNFTFIVCLSKKELMMTVIKSMFASGCHSHRGNL